MMLTRKAADEKREHAATVTFRLTARRPQSRLPQPRPSQSKLLQSCAVAHPLPPISPGFTAAAFPCHTAPFKMGASCFDSTSCSSCGCLGSATPLGFRFQDRTGQERQCPPAARKGAGGNATEHRHQHYVGPCCRHRRLDRSGSRARDSAWHWPRWAEDAQAADGLRLSYAYYVGLKEADLADIIAYLRTVPPLQ
jgi:hypothetical protein